MPSHLKDQAQGLPRQPSQKRSRERYETLIEATRTLVMEGEVSRIGIYEIAKRAGVPTASTYHFFPSVEAALVELSSRHLQMLSEAINQPPSDLPQPAEWQDLVALRFWRAVDFYNGDPVAQRLFLTGTALSAMRETEESRTRELAAGYYNWLDTHLPHGLPPSLAPNDFRFRMMLAIFEGTSMAIYAEHGFLPRERCLEALRAMLLYGQTFLSVE